MSITVLNGGGLVTVQDLGRTGYQRFGFSVSGAMDRTALTAANALVDNAPGEAVLEILLAPPVLRADTMIFCAVTGGGFDPLINGVPAERYTAFCLQPGDELRFAPTADGRCAYLAVAGGFDLPLVMGSRSTNLKCGIGGFEGRKLRAGDVLPLRNPPILLPALAARRLPRPAPIGRQEILRVVAGPQNDCFTSAGLYRFTHYYYRVTEEYDRMGCRFAGPRVETKHGSDIVSDGIAAGSVQIPPSGQPIVMLSDRQTTGGYTKIAAVITADLPKLAQCRLGTLIRFLPVTVETAQEAARTMMRRENNLKLAFEMLL